MILLLSINLTLIILCVILIKVKKKKIFKAKIKYRQSHIHEVIKDFLPKGIINKPFRIDSQSKRHTEKNMIRVIMIDGKAYWVSENIFYVSETVNGDPDLETAKPVDTSNMSKQEIEKMLSILDTLKKGTSDDSGSTRNN